MNWFLPKLPVFETCWAQFNWGTSIRALQQSLWHSRLSRSYLFGNVGDEITNVPSNRCCIASRRYHISNMLEMGSYNWETHHKKSPKSLEEVEGYVLLGCTGFVPKFCSHPLAHESLQGRRIHYDQELIAANFQCNLAIGNNSTARTSLMRYYRYYPLPHGTGSGI